MQEARLRYIFGNGLAALAERLADDLQAAPLADILDADVVVVPHPGMGRWLQQFLAQRWGIATLIDAVLPAQFAWRVLGQLRNDLPDTSAYDREPLLWRIHALLPVLAREPAFTTIAEYLSDDDPRKAYELADRLAGVFEQYLLYRPGWLARWQRNETIGAPHPHEAWQGELWRRLRADVGEPHRAELIRDLARRVHEGRVDPRALPPRVNVLGVSSLPPVYLELFAALGARTDLRVYHVNPSAEYWGDITIARERPRLIAKLQREGIAEPEAYLDEGHPLLASWWRLGRDFVQLLFGQPALQIEDELVTHEATPRTVLDWLRASIAKLDPALPPPPTIGDSLRIVGCASRLREVEVLHDALLARFERDPTLTPRDVVVMTPRLADYAPLVDAVFGAAPDARRIPYTIADRATGGTHAIARAFRTLLDLPHSRLPASEVLDLLRVDAIARRFGLRSDDHARLVEWIECTKIRWGLDGAERERAGFGDYDDFTWRAGLDRLLLGYATGAVDELVGGALPFAGLEGQGAVAAGALARFVERLAEWRARLGASRDIEAWQVLLGNMLLDLFDGERGNLDELAAIEAIREVVKDMRGDMMRAAADGVAIAHAVMQAALEARFEQPERRQRLLSTGVTVCAMVPMRNVPFRVVCLLGLDDGEFPRREPAASFNLMRAFPQLGDRNRSDDDRYLFLEALLAARDHLHLSYQAVNARDGSERAPASVVEELANFVATAFVGATSVAISSEDEAKDRDLRRSHNSDGEPASVGATSVAISSEVEAKDRDLRRSHTIPAIRESFWTKAPATPFSAEAFDANSPHQTYAAEWLPAAQSAIGPRRDAPAFLAAAGRPQAIGVVALDDLLAWIRDPPKDYCRRVLELSLPESQESEDDEPFEHSGLDAYQLNDALLARLSRRPDADDASLAEILRAQGLLRAGRLGDADARRAIATVRMLVVSYRTKFAATRPESREIELPLGALTLRGRLDGIVNGTPVRLRAGGARGPDWLALALAAKLVGAKEAWFLGIEKGNAVVRSLDAALIADSWLPHVVQLYARSRGGFLPLTRRASWDYAQAGSDPEAARKKAKQTFAPHWQGDDTRAEIDDAHVALLWRGQPLEIDANFAAVATAVYGAIAPAIVVP